MLNPEPERIVVKAANWLGDLVMSLPAMRVVRRSFPRARFSVLVKRELAGFFDGSVWADEVIPYSMGSGARRWVARARIITELRRRRFDLGIAFPNSFEAAFWLAAAGVTRRAGVAGQGRGRLLTHRTKWTKKSVTDHEVYYRLRMLRETLGIDGEPGDFVPDVAAPHRARMGAWLAEHRRVSGGVLVALAPGAAYGPAKEWPANHYAALVDLLAERHGAECVLVGSPGERSRCEEVAGDARRGALVAAGETKVGELIALLSLCDGFAGNDSGAMHVAGALGIPTVGVFGSTRPDRTRPLGPRTEVLYLGIDCSPCLARHCRFGHYRCLTEITAAAAEEALVRLGLFGAS